MAEIPRCPFCKSRRVKLQDFPKALTPGHRARDYVFDYCVVECSACGATGPQRKTDHGAIRAWSRAVYHG